MPRKQTSTIPKYRRQKSKPHDRAFVELNGTRVYLGRWRSSESKARYARLVADWEGNGRQLPVAADEITVVELVARFLSHAESYYRREDGSTTKEAYDMRNAMRPVRELFGSTPVSQFGPRALKAVRQGMIDADLSRRVINQRVNRIRHVFRRGVAEELVTPDVLRGLEAVAGLKRGRTEARETDGVRPVHEDHVAAIEPHVSRQVWALVQLQICTAARSGELVGIRPVDIDMSGPVWLYHPAQHKNSWRGRERTIFVGPRGQEIIRPFLQDRPIDKPLFSPAEADADFRAGRTADRKTPKSCGHVVGSNRKRKPARTPGDCYTPDSYRRSIQSACDKAGIPRWHPHQLRHLAATRLRKEYGLEAAQIMLGHSKCDTTQLYAEVNRDKALSLAAKIG